jgi:hypothetical protein
VLILYFL